MISLLSRLFISDRQNYSDSAVRSAYGVLCGAVGIFFNLLLFCAKNATIELNTQEAGKTAFEAGRFF